MNHYDDLNKLHVNLKKSVNNKIRTETLLSKQKICDIAYKEIEKYLHKNCEVIEENEFNKICKNSRLWNSEINEIIRRKLEENKIVHKLNHSVRNKTKENAMAFNIATAAQLASLIPAFDGKPSGAKAFTDAIELAKIVVPADNHESAIKLVLTKMTGKARDLFSEQPESMDAIIQKVKDNCLERESSDLVSTRLKNIKIKKSEDIRQFTKEVDNLCDNLAQAYIREEVPSGVAKKLAQKQAIQTLVQNAQKSETKIMLRVGKFNNLNEALNVVIENEEQSTETTAALLQVNHTKRQLGYYANNRQNNNFQYQRYRNPNTYRGRFNTRGRGGYNRGNHRNNQFRNNRNYYQNDQNRQHGSRVFYAQENPFQQVEPLPDLVPVPPVAQQGRQGNAQQQQQQQPQRAQHFLGSQALPGQFLQ